jgi:transcriptional regulator with XRE-family HTH domain
VVVRIERGANSRLNRETVEKLAALYHVDLDSLLPTGVSLDDFEGSTRALSGLPVASAADGEDRPSTVDQAGGDVPSTQARIRQLRASTGLSASAFAKKLSTKAAPISERDIEDWECARRRPTRDHLDAIELLTGASPGWVMTGRKR